MTPPVCPAKGQGEAPGRRLSYWITKTLRENREAAGVSKAHIAAVLGDVERTVDRIEKGDSWGRDIDRAVAAYAYALGLKDSRDLWRAALYDWYTHGAPPRFTDAELPGMTFVLAIRDEARRHLPLHSELSGTPCARTKKREAQ